ncbi:MAG: FAD-dependent oxidoreductase [Halioglobus sp.]
MKENKIPLDSHIAVVGGGAGGLSTAWYLKRAGYKHVQVLEKSPRLGGKCRSVTVDGQSFDLGANYITSSYTRVREMAAHVKAEMYTEDPGHVLDIGTGQMQSIFREILSQTNIFKLAWQGLRYAWIRWRLSNLLSPASPGFVNVKGHAELHGDFESWLKGKNLEALIPMFEIPLTLMGYGQLKQIAAVYALTYMNLGTFKDLGLFAINFPLRRWPKRFNQGYGRMFERLAAEVDVLTGVTITKITRDDKVVIEFELLEQQREQNTTDTHIGVFDYIVLACPQVPEVLKSLNMDFSSHEKGLFDKVRYNPFYVTTYKAPGTERVSAVTFSMPEPEMGEPYVVTRQYPENDFVSVYTRGDWDGTIDREHIRTRNIEFLKEIGASNPGVQEFSCDDWAYFPHFSPEEVDGGAYNLLDNHQGENRTFFAGGLLAFELVETIAEHAHHLVKTHFVGDV